jgi:pyruvate,water dikinase
MVVSLASNHAAVGGPARRWTANANPETWMQPYVLTLTEIDRSQVALAGGKGANLGALSRLDGIRVPDGFCVTTDAFERVIVEISALDERLDRLSHLAPDDHETIRALSAEIRRGIETVDIPNEIATAIGDALARLGEHDAYAVRSSASAEDLPSVSSAGQHDSYLNVSGRAAILERVRRCWGSLFTERAVTYRLHTGVDHRQVRMAVVVQRMVDAQLSGVLFTADPVTGNRKVATVEATVGLGEAFVSGRVNADVHQVRDGRVVTRKVAAERSTLTDEQLTRLVALGRGIEVYFGHPQDVEWCLADDGFHVVQSRPITALFPIPDVTDGMNHVYVSVGHQQMMTDAMKPLGLSVWQMTTPRPMAEAGGRLFVDVTQALASPGSRGSLLATLGKSDPRISDALQQLLDRGDFVRELQDAGPAWTPPGNGAPSPVATDPAIATELIDRSEASLAELTREMGGKSGSVLLAFIRDDLRKRKGEQFDPRSLQVIMAGMEAAWWLNEHMQEWLDETNAADVLTQSVPNNVTSQMGLALLDVADVIRPHAEVVAFLERANDDRFLDELPSVTGGREARDAIVAWLDRYGMRGPGEIDITRPRWREHPVMLVPMILANVRTFEPGAAARHFEQGRGEAARKEAELLGRLRALSDGERKAEETKGMIDRLRTFAGYREHPKYVMVSRYFVYKEALMEEAERLAKAGVIDGREDIFFLRFDELEAVVRTQRADRQLIKERREAFHWYQSLKPPRVLTSEGEMLSGRYRRGDVQPGALLGLAVSTGIVEGRARVVLDMAEATLAPGDILVTAYTDPSWTPLFVVISGLVTEVGGLMTHGAVIAREYGVPAVVGVEEATRMIRDGEWIRVNGTEGWVEVVTRSGGTVQVGDGRS